MKQATVKLPSGEYCFQEVPGIAMASSLFCNMGYLVYKMWDSSKMITDKDIADDLGRFIKTGRSKYEGATVGDSLKQSGAKLPDGNWQLLGADPTNLTEKEAGEIVGVNVHSMIRIKVIDSLAASLGIEKPFVVLKNINSHG